MGRGAQTQEDGFSALLGSRRGSGRDAALCPLHGLSDIPRPLEGGWGPCDFDGGVIFLFSRRLSAGSLGEGHGATLHLDEIFPGMAQQLHEPRADGVLVPASPLQAVADVDLHEVARGLERRLGFAEGEVVPAALVEGSSPSDALAFLPAQV
jgi:hypothetical protein